MTWTEIRSWAKSKGYDTIKHSDGYYWAKINDVGSSGVSPSVSKLARDIFNHITDNKYLDHQQEYIREVKHEQTR